ncbi:MAG TPA: SDR family NAD(P)-dependent oxidoreductase [Gammaproteobacteria bacterium]|nr:SDR family NAD(P)-dependent oxidoreductase [Gammaproteobacteria bacterium]
MEIKNLLAVVTGAASGVGRACAETLGALGATVILIDINKEKIDEIAKTIKGIACAIDITDPQAVEDAFAQIVANQTLPLRILINCAGIAPASRIFGKEGCKPLDFFSKVINVNLIGTYNVLRVASFYMSKQEVLETTERGVIINTASIAAFEGQIGQTAYSASKAAIVGLTLPAARELAQFGIRVMTIAPGLLDTPMLSTLPQDVRESLEKQTPFPKRFGKPEEFAALAQSIIENPMLNGEVIRLDGGLRMQPS